MVHGYKNGLLRIEEYNNLTQCDNISDLKAQLQVTEYGNFLQNESAATLTTRLIVAKAQEKLCTEFEEIRSWADPPLSHFLDFITYEHMLNNVLKLITSKRGAASTAGSSSRPNGATQGGASLDILYRLHPLGALSGLSSLLAASSIDEMFGLVLIDSPIGQFFQTSQSRKDLDELSIEFLRAMLWKNYIQAFYDLVLKIGGDTAKVMVPVLEFEADRIVVTVAANTCGMRDLQPADRKKLFPNLGTLVDAHEDLADAESLEQLKERLKRFHGFADLFEGASGDKNTSGSSSSVEKKLVERSVAVYWDAMSAQFQYGVFYGWVKLKELEVQNLQWISDCVVQGMKQRVNEYINLVPSTH